MCPLKLISTQLQLHTRHVFSKMQFLLFLIHNTKQERKVQVHFILSPSFIWNLQVGPTKKEISEGCKKHNLAIAIIASPCNMCFGLLFQQ